MTYIEKMDILAETAKEDNIKSAEGQRIFAYLCDSATDYHDAANVTPMRLIIQTLGYTKYRVRKEIAVLKEQGLVKRTVCGFPAYEIYTENGLTDCDEAHPPINGFGLTDKGYESNTYKKADEILNDEYRHICDDRIYTYVYYDKDNTEYTETVFLTEQEAVNRAEQLKNEGYINITYTVE